MVAAAAIRVGASASIHQRAYRDPAWSGWMHLPTANQDTGDLVAIDESILIEPEEELTSYVENAVPVVDTVTGSYVVRLYLAGDAHAYANGAQRLCDDAVSAGRRAPHRGMIVCHRGRAFRPFTYADVRDAAARGGPGYVVVAHGMNLANAQSLAAALNAL